MRRSPFGLHPNGPYPTQGPQSGDVVRQASGAIDMRGVSGWRSVFTVDCAELIWGQLVVTGEAIASGAADIPSYYYTISDAIFSGPVIQRIEVWPWIEVRIVAWVNGQTYTMLEAAVGSHDGPQVGGAQKTAGAIVLPFAVGEVPDKIEVFARARLGGGPDTRASVTDGKLTLLATSRFHK
jgi:hypothetical protein